MKNALITFSLRYPKTVLTLTLLVMAFFAVQFPKVQVDTALPLL